MKEIQDNFSAGAADYALYRPESPKEIFDFIYKNLKSRDAAWDCGTGNGQVAAQLATQFKTVYATDISAEQLKNAVQKSNITYRQERAEATSLPDKSVDLITVGQAIHWFDFDVFYNEVYRVAKPGALFAAWTYSTLKVNPAVDEVINHLYADITHSYWDKERRYVDEHYSTIPFPFDELEAPDMKIVRRYTLKQLVGYLYTWSGLKHYVAQKKEDPMDIVMDDLEKAWGDNETLEVTWPVHVRAGFVISK